MEATSTLSKRRIASAFSKGALKYQNEAIQQKEAALALSTFFKSVEGDLLEIGCGTGFLTEQILRKYPGKLLGIDLSLEMVEMCQKKFPSHQFMVGDGERLSEEERFSAIFSGMTLQWFQERKKSIASIRRALKPGGTFYFSFINERSYPEWTFFPLNPPMHIGFLLEEFGNVEFKELEFVTTYQSPLAFLKELKRLGVSASVDQKSRLKELLKVAKCGNMISITSRITIGCCHV